MTTLRALLSIPVGTSLIPRTCELREASRPCFHTSVFKTIGLQVEIHTKGIDGWVPCCRGNATRRLDPAFAVTVTSDVG